MKEIDDAVKGRSIGSGVLCAMVQLIALVSPFLMGRIIDDYVPARNWTMTAVAIAAFILLPFISIAIQTGWNYMTIRYVRKKGNDYALKVMENLIYEDMKFYDKEKSMELLSYAGREFTDYISFRVMEMPKYVVGIIVSVIIFALLCFINPILGLLQLLYLPFAFYPVKRMMKDIENEIQLVVKNNAEISQIRGDIFQAIEFIKLSGLERKKLSEIDGKNKEINSVWGRISALDSLSGIWTTGFATVLFTGITFSIGMLLYALSGAIQIGQLVSAITYSAVLYANINAALQMGIRKRKEEVQYAKSFEFLESHGEREENRGKSEFSFNDRIEFKNTEFSYADDKKVLNGLDMVIEKGKWTGITGESGSGKSTTLDLLVKLYPVADGSLFIDGKDINTVDSFSIRRAVTKVTQDIYLFPGTVRENLMLMGENLADKDLLDALEFASLSDWLKALPDGLDSDVGEAGKLMSGGEKQRLSIAMGILRKSRVYLLDEVTSALDEENERKIADNFSKLRDSGCTIVSVTHNPQFIEKADRVYIVDKGKERSSRSCPR